MGKNRNKSVGNMAGGGPENRGGAPQNQENKPNNQPKSNEKQPQKSQLETIVDRINNGFDGFIRSVKQDIDVLYYKDHSGPIELKSTGKGATANETLAKSLDTIRAIEYVQEVIRQEIRSGKATDTNPGARLEQLNQEKNRLQEAIDSYMFRSRERLASGQKQLTALLTEISDGTNPKSKVDDHGYETNPEYKKQDDRFKGQPDIRQEYANAVMAGQVIERTFAKYRILRPDETPVSFSEVISFVDQVVKLGDKMSKEQRAYAIRLLKPLEELSDFPAPAKKEKPTGLAVFGAQAKERYLALKKAIESEVIAKTLREKQLIEANQPVPDISKVLEVSDNLAENGDVGTWTEQECIDYLRLIQSLKELSSLPVSGEQAQEVLEKLTLMVQITAEKLLDSARVPELAKMSTELPPGSDKSDPEIKYLVEYLNNLFNSKRTEQTDGWVPLSEEEAEDFVAVAEVNKREVVRRLMYLDGIRPHRDSAEVKKAKVQFCQAVENFARNYAEAQKQLALILPIINELQLVNTYGKAEKQLPTIPEKEIAA